jgi:hypothetical protein
MKIVGRAITTESMGHGKPLTNEIYSANQILANLTQLVTAPKML